MEKDLIVLSGKMAAGKSTIAKIFKEKYNYKILSISTPIRNLVKTMIEKPEKVYAVLENYLVQEKKEKVKKITEELQKHFEENYKEEKWKKNENGEYNKTQAFRSLMQYTATKIRTEYTEDIWTRIVAKMAVEMTADGSKVIIDDLRLKEEKRILESVGFVSVRINISKEEQEERIKKLYGELKKEVLEHKTEIDLDDAYFDYVIDAEQSLEEIEETVKKIV